MTITYTNKNFKTTPEKTTFLVQRKNHFSTDSFVTPNTIFRSDISDGVERYFHDRDKTYGFIQKNQYGKTPFYLVDKLEILEKIGKLGELRSQTHI